MRRVFSILLLFLVTSARRCRRDSRKDGTKIVGHMTAVNSDKIEVEPATARCSFSSEATSSLSVSRRYGPACSRSPQPLTMGIPRNR